MKKKKINKEDNTFKSKLKRFFSSWSILVIALMILLIVLICFVYAIMNSSKTYTFYGSSKYIIIDNGVISTNYSIDLFEGSDISYSNKTDYNIIKYTIGYYVKVNGKMKKLAVISGSDDNGLSLKGVIEENDFNIVEPTHNKKYFSKVNSKAFKDNNLYFIINATTKKGSLIKDTTKISVSKISK